MQDAKGDRCTTYADGDGVHQQHVITHKEDVIGMVRNESNLGYGMFGVMGNTSGTKKLKQRIGALLARIKGKHPVQKSDNPKPDTQKDDAAPVVTAKSEPTKDTPDTPKTNNTTALRIHSKRERE